MFVAVVTSGLLILVLIASMLPSIITNLGNFFAHDNFCKNVQSRAINFDRQRHFKIWLDCHKLKMFPFLIMPVSTKCKKKNQQKITINVTT
jgi:hypothetical protein